MIDEPERVLRFRTELANDATRAWPAKYSQIALAAAYLGHAELALDTYLRESRYTPIRHGGLWYPIVAEARRLPAFKRFAIDTGLVEHWRQHGWSDFCRPAGTEDFVCDQRPDAR